ncbi:OmpH family outer membrane protein [Pelagibacterales bacterium SAG-MED17]|nr:OmpH family outer membrane protein [Pelagibacterales bacterium SAG-MED17]
MKNYTIGIFFFLCSSFYSYAQIVYIDVNFILNNSEVGKSLNIYIKELNDKNLTSYKEIEDQFLKKEKELLAQKNILEKSDFDKKLKKLSKEVNIYRSEKKMSLTKLNEIKINNTKKILNILNPIITNYVDKNSISLVIPKKNIIVGKKNLEITSEIVKLLNDKVKSLEF